MARATRCRAIGDRRRLFGYTARGVPYGPDDGTLAGWAATRVAAVRARNRAVAVRSDAVGAIRRCVRISATRAVSIRGSIDAGGKCWVSAGHFGLDQGIVTMMIENYRTQLIWRLMRSVPTSSPDCGAPDSRGGWL